MNFLNNLQIFKHSEFGELPTVEIDGKPYFHASKSAKILGYKDTINAVKQHCKGVVKHHTLTAGGTQIVNYILEGDLYRLIMGSTLPAAGKFERWVFDEVLPQIRQTGGYIPRTEGDTDEQVMAKAVLIAQRTIEQQTKQIVEMKPKVDYYDLILNCKDLVSVTQIAKDFGKSAMWLNKFLHEKGVQFRKNSIWYPYQKYADEGYMASKSTAITYINGEPNATYHTYWTQKGRRFIYDLLKSDGISANIERKE